MKKLHFFFIGMIVLILPFLMAAGSGDKSQEPEHSEDGIASVQPVELEGRPLNVVVSTSFISDIAKNIGGDNIEVFQLISRGQSPHSYSPSPSEVARIVDADVVLVNGFELETELLEVIEGLEGLPLVSVSEGVNLIKSEEDEHHDEDMHHEEDEHHDEEENHDEEVHEEEHHHGEYDPHTWMSPRNVMIWSDNIAAAFSAADPGNADVYVSAASDYKKQLESLDSEIKYIVAGIPPLRRKLVVDHEVMAYFARDYGFEILGSVIPSVSDQGEPSARQIADLTGKLIEENISTIFVGEQASRGLNNLVEAIASEAGLDVGITTMLTGSLANEGSRGDNYLDFMRYNIEAIEGALVN